MPVTKKVPIADVMARVRNSIAAHSGADRNPDTPFEGQLNRHLEEAMRLRRVVLPPDTRWAFAKRLVLRILKVYTRYSEIFNYNVCEFLFKLNSKVNYIATRREKQAIENAEAIARLARSVEQLASLVASTGSSGRLEQNSVAATEAADATILHTLKPDADRISDEGVHSDIVSELSSVGRVLDLYCDRGQLLQTLNCAGVQAVGIDPRPNMISHCMEKGLTAILADPVTHLQKEPDRWDAIHLLYGVEDLHVTPLAELLQLARERLQPNGILVLEARHPYSLWPSISPQPRQSFPLQPSVLEHLLARAGFGAVRTKYTGNPQPLPRIRKPVTERDNCFNQAMDRLDQVLACYEDYFIVARRS